MPAGWSGEEHIAPTDTSANSVTCGFIVNTFDACLQDDSMGDTVLLWNSATGDYKFCCGGTS